MDPQSYFKVFRIEELRRDVEIERRRAARERMAEDAGMPAPHARRARRTRHARRVVPPRFA